MIPKIGDIVIYHAQNGSLAAPALITAVEAYYPPDHGEDQRWSLSLTVFYPNTIPMCRQAEGPGHCRDILAYWCWK